MKKTRVLIVGIAGRMGRIIAKAVASESDLVLIGGVLRERSDINRITGSVLPNNLKTASDIEELVDECDCIVEFTNPSATISHIRKVSNRPKPYVIGTTGFTEVEIKQIKEMAHRIPLFLSPNMAIGMNVLFRLVKNAAGLLRDADIEILELHHKMKKDAPSGTAVKILDILRQTRELRPLTGREGRDLRRKREEVGIFSLRAGDVMGEHTVIFAQEGERIELTHRVTSRSVFERGVLYAIRFIVSKPPGFYTMDDLIETIG